VLIINTDAMASVNLYDHVSFEISKLVTKTYSTSFSIAVSFLETHVQKAICSIYGFVRFADEIVDSFDQYDKGILIDKFEKDYYDAYENGISMNPVLHSFQVIVKRYQIPNELIQSFLKSMKADLYKTKYRCKSEIDEYIYGSADVVGLMCLKVFTDKDDALYETLKLPAKRLGSAFQKVNFLRDLKSDLEFLDRQYFPEIGDGPFNDGVKAEIIIDIEKDFQAARKGIPNLPEDAKLAVLIAFYYYERLLNKIRHTPASKLMTARIRISGTRKMVLLAKALAVYRLNLI